MTEPIRDKHQDAIDAHDQEIAKRDERIEQLEAELKEATESLEAIGGDHADEIRALETTLEVVKYWMHDVLIHHRPVTNPRAILRIVEAAL